MKSHLIWAQLHMNSHIVRVGILWYERPVQKACDRFEVSSDPTLPLLIITWTHIQVTQGG